MRGSVMSLTYWPRPWVRRAKFGRGTARPMYEFGRSSAVRVEGRSPTIFTRAPSNVVHSFAVSHPLLRHRLHRIDNRVITGAAAVITRQVLADLRAVERPAGCKQFLCGEQHARCAEAALQRVACGKGLLQIGDLALIRHPLDRFDPRAVALHREHQAAPHDLAVY